jgi:ribosomal protein S3
MGCSECARLEAERERQERVLAIATAFMNAVIGEKSSEYRDLEFAVHDAHVDLELVMIEISEHQKRRHAGATA